MKINYKVFIPFLALIPVIMLLFAGISLSADPPIVTPGYLSQASNVGHVRFRSLKTDGVMGGGEIYEGVGDIGQGANRTELNLQWSTVNTATFSYDTSNDQLNATVENDNGSWTLDYPDFTTNVKNIVYGGDVAQTVYALNALNYLQIDVTLRSDTPAQVDFVDVFLDGYSLGDFFGLNGGTESWHVSGYDLSGGFTISGTILLEDLTGNSEELNKIEIHLGFVDDQGPLTFDVEAEPNPVMVGQPITITALVDDSLTGGSTIKSAEYSLNGGSSWSPMQASDGSFDGVSEAVIASIGGVGEPSYLDLCVRATDFVDNLGATSCTKLLILPQDKNGPLASNIASDPSSIIVGVPMTVTATIDDSSTGGSLISAAEFTLDNGQTWLPMGASDGTFDSVSEDVIQTLSAPSVAGPYALCVRGQDSAGNIGGQVCIIINIMVTPVELQYKFIPFFRFDS